jgi:hypothetical protein
MPKRFAVSRWLKIGAVVSLGTVFQAGGCAVDTQALAAELLTTFAGLLISTFVNNFFGVGFGFGL